MERRKQSHPNPNKKPLSSLIVQPALGNKTFKSVYEIFPEELWEQILDQLEDSRDVQNVLAASEELDSVFQTRKPRWLIDQVFPFIYAEIHQRFIGNILKCRTVSRRWCKVAEDFLADHPSRRPYNPNGMSRRTLTYHECVYRDQSEPQFPTLRLCTPEKVTALLNKLEEPTLSVNPFLLRVVELNHKHMDDDAFKSIDEIMNSNHFDLFDEKKSEDFLDSCIAFVQSFGHHIWDLVLKLGPFNSDKLVQRRVFGKIVAFLSHVPNLRALDFRGQLVHRIYDLSWSKEHPFPALPLLETLKINAELLQYAHSSSLLDALFMTYAQTGQLKRLEIPSEFWSTSYNKYCTNVTQLSIKASLIPSILHKNRGFSSLQKLQINHMLDGPLNLFDVLQMISGFPIEELDMCDPYTNKDIVWRPRAYVETPIVPSVKWLRIWDTGNLDFEILKALPHLQHLHVIGLQNMGGEFVSNHENQPDTISGQVRSYIYLDCIPENVSIWKTLPSLQILTVGVGYCYFFYRRQFFREYCNKIFLK